MAHNEITKFQLLAAIIGQDRAYRELEGAEAFGDILIELCRRMHHWYDSRYDAIDVIDAMFEGIAEEFRYAIGEWDEAGNDTDSTYAEPTKGDILNALEETIAEVRGIGAGPRTRTHGSGSRNPEASSSPAAEHRDDNAMPPELDIPNDH